MPCGLEPGCQNPSPSRSSIPGQESSTSSRQVWVPRPWQRLGRVRGGSPPCHIGLAHLDAKLAGKQRPDCVADVAQEAVQEAEDRCLPLALPQAPTGQPRAEGEAAPAVLGAVGCQSRAAQSSPGELQGVGGDSAQRSQHPKPPGHTSWLPGQASRWPGSRGTVPCSQRPLHGWLRASLGRECHHRLPAPPRRCSTQHHPPPMAPISSPGVESTACCWEQTPGRTRAP